MGQEAEGDAPGWGMTPRWGWSWNEAGLKSCLPVSSRCAVLIARTAEFEVAVGFSQRFGGKKLRALAELVFVWLKPIWISLFSVS